MFYAFDVLVRRGEDFTKQTLSKRRDIFASTIKPRDQRQPVGTGSHGSALPRRPARTSAEEATIATPTLMKPIVTKLSCQG